MSTNTMQNVSINLMENKNATTQDQTIIVANAIKDLSELLCSLQTSLKFERMLPK